MILASSTLAQSYLAEGYQTQVTGDTFTYPFPPASSNAWEVEPLTVDATWTIEAGPGNP